MYELRRSQKLSSYSSCERFSYSNFQIILSEIGTTMSNDSDQVIASIKESYDRLAPDYSLRISNELSGKPLDRILLKRFSVQVKQGLVCDLGCGPGHIASYLHEMGTNVFGIDLSEKMVEQAHVQSEN